MMMTVLSGMSIGQTNFWIRRLSHVLKNSLREGSYLPERNPDAPEDALKKCPGLSFVTDVAERRMQSPEDPEKQKFFFSGKKSAIR